MKRMLAALTLGLLLGLGVVMPMAFGQVGQGSNASGKAAKLAAAWTQWAYSKPVGVSPLLGSYTGGAKCDGTPVSPTQGKQWFLAGTTTGESVVRTCTMPVGTHLFFPVVSIVAFPFLEGETEQNQRQLAIDFINSVLADPAFTSSVKVEVDGKAVKSNRIVRALSPVFTLTLPEANVFDCPQCNPPIDVPEGEYEGASANGLWVTLPPLPPGEHTIHFKFEMSGGGFKQDNTYILTVVNKR